MNQTFNCKICGAPLNVTDSRTICECEYCNTKQIIPLLDSDKKKSLFSRAIQLRIENEFDKAASIYESIVSEFPAESEAYWGLVLCKYGIEYVDDPKTGKKVPTCHRTIPSSIFDDKDFNNALSFASNEADLLYREEAKQINKLQESILSIVKEEKPYDVFICYKETDENGKRTKDSTVAQELFEKLTDKGYKTFFSKISLEDKIGQEYEPYIYAALQSAKVMLVIGSDPSYFNSVWVKNEWGRFLSFMKNDKGKMIIPCYFDMNPYDLPIEFRNLQGVDLNAIGSTQDLIRGIEKLVGTKKTINNEQIEGIIDKTIKEQRRNNKTLLIVLTVLILAVGAGVFFIVSKSKNNSSVVVVNNANSNTTFTDANEVDSDANNTSISSSDSFPLNITYGSTSNPAKIEITNVSSQFMGILSDSSGEAAAYDLTIEYDVKEKLRYSTGKEMSTSYYRCYILFYEEGVLINQGEFNIPASLGKGSVKYRANILIKENERHLVFSFKESN